MKQRQSSSSSSSKQRKRKEEFSPPPQSEGSQRRIGPNYAPPERIALAIGSDFGEEIEDQYYKRSVPSGFVLSPKRNSEAPQLSPKSPTEILSSYNDPLMMGGYGDEDDEDDIDLDEA